MLRFTLLLTRGWQRYVRNRLPLSGHFFAYPIPRLIVMFAALVALIIWTT